MANYPTVWVDFNTHLGNEVSLASVGTRHDLTRLGITLRKGLHLRVADAEFAATGVVVWSDWQGGMWMLRYEAKDFEELMPPGQP